MAKIKKKVCATAKIWGWSTCKECDSRPWPKCKNNSVWHKPTLEEWMATGWPKNKTKKERLAIQESLKKAKWFQKQSAEDQKDMLELSWGLSKPTTLKERREAYRDFMSLPDYKPLPSGPGEVQATFIQRKK